MTSMTLFILFVSIIAVLFLIINLFLAPHNSYQEKKSAFECGFHSFLQTRLPFNISFYINAMIFLIFDLELFTVFPYSVSSYNNQSYGLFAIIAFLVIVTIGFVFEIGKGALTTYSKQNITKKIEIEKKISYIKI